MSRTVARDEQGKAYAEYLILAVVFGLPIAGTFVFLGLELLATYHHAMRVLTSPVT
jgi:hypothetical protein